VGYATCPWHSVLPPPLRREVLAAIHMVGFREVGHLAVAQTSRQYVTLLGTWPTFFFFFSTDMYLYDHMTSTHMTAYLYNRTILSGTSLFPPFVCFLLFSSYGSL